MKLSKKFVYKFMILVIILSAVAGSLTTLLVLGLTSPSKETMIEEFYLTENEISVSPHHIRKGMAKGDESFILVDLRSEEEYIEEHIVGAVNIPAYKDKDHSDYGAVERIVASFKELEENNPGKDIIVHCYSIPCMTGKKVGKMLAENGIYVQHLGIGWNEWRYFWTMWNHPHEWNITNVEDYVISGIEPGKINEILVSASCPIEGGLGC
jgi:rhodanese-related sulfurtransferase